jgi:hypothetical protein
VASPPTTPTVIIALVSRSMLDLILSRRESVRVPPLTPRRHCVHKKAVRADTALRARALLSAVMP